MMGEAEGLKMRMEWRSGTGGGRMVERRVRGRAAAV
jgi:hypothetical protein